MKIKLLDGRKASDQEIRTFEAMLGCRLSDAYKDFVRMYDGAKPEPNLFRIRHNYSLAVNRFVPISEILQERPHIDSLHKCAYPVALDDCGNYIFIDEDRGGAVFFWDLELPDDPVRLAGSFSEFLDALEVDTTTVQLKPGRVKKAWVDPEFLKRLNSKKPN